MSKYLYATSNHHKFVKAQQNLQPFNIELQQINLEMSELQTIDGTKITRHKARQAFEQLQEPVLVNDDTWHVTALRGFPATGMKLCNTFLSAADWLRLMADVANREAELVSHYCWYDGKNMILKTSTLNCRVLKASQGEYAPAPFLEVVARQNSVLSIAQEIAQHNFAEPELSDFWQELAQVLVAN